MAAEQVDRGKVVVLAGTGINLALGVLYTWSIFKGAIKQSIVTGGPGSFDWDIASLNDPYAVCCLVFAFMMIVAGKVQDVFGPRVTAITGGILVGLGFIFISGTTSYYAWILGFGILVGTGIAFGYSSATPPALKWFPPTQTGLVAGIVVAGFGLASVYIAPLAQYLLGTLGLGKAMFIFGIAFLVVVCFLGFFLQNPPKGFQPKGFVDRRRSCKNGQKARTEFVDINSAPSELIKTANFWLLWFLFFIGAGAGLMVIGSVAGMAKASLGTKAFWAVALLAIGNAGGRIAAGLISDKFGRKKTLAGVFLFQALLLFLAAPILEVKASSAFLLVLLTMLIGFNYGANLTLFPSFTKDLWGIKNFGVNYGIIFTAWGVGGFVMSRASQSLMASSNSFSSSFMTAALMLVVGAVLTFFVRDHKEEQRKQVSLSLAPENT